MISASYCCFLFVWLFVAVNGQISPIKPAHGPPATSSQKKNTPPAPVQKKHTKTPTGPRPPTAVPITLPPTVLPIGRPTGLPSSFPKSNPTLAPTPPPTAVPTSPPTVSGPSCPDSCAKALSVAPGSNPADASCVSQAGSPVYICRDAMFRSFPSNWFQFQAPPGGCSASVSVVLTGASDFAPNLAVYEGSKCIPSACVTATSGAQYSPTLSWNARSGASYFIVMITLAPKHLSTYNLDLKCD